MVCDLVQVEFLALLYVKQKSVFSLLVRQKANPAISCWAALGSLRFSITVGMELFLNDNKMHVQQLLFSWWCLFLIFYRERFSSGTTHLWDRMRFNQIIRYLFCQGWRNWTVLTDDINLTTLLTSRLDSFSWPFSSVFSLWSVLFLVRIDAVRSDLDRIYWGVPVGLKVQRAFETARSILLCALSRAISQRWDEVWKGHGQGQ